MADIQSICKAILFRLSVYRLRLKAQGSGVGVIEVSAKARRSGFAAGGEPSEHPEKVISD
jgi:hypothetical protein